MNRGKYDRRIRFHTVRLQRAALRGVIRHLVRWRPMQSPLPGYSVIIGCTHRLAHMLPSNLRMLARQDATGMRDVLIVVDAARETLPLEFERSIIRQFPNLPLRFLYYTPHQVRVTGLVRWAWVYAWLSWSKGIAAAETHHVLLHDFDAMLIRKDILRQRYERMLHGDVEYLGVRYYDCNGVLEADRLVTTFELMFDAAFVRRHFKPLDLFNHVCRWRGRTVDFDTFLYAQTRRGRKAIAPLGESDMVHPSQMICQFTELMNGRELNPTCSSLLLIPYFLRVGSDDDQTMASIERQLNSNGGSTVDFFGKRLNIARLNRSHAQWLAKQAGSLEQAVFGGVRREVQSYFDTVCSKACQ